MSYQIVTDATADLSAEMMAGLPPVLMLSMDITVGEKSFTYGPDGDITVPQFYAAQRSGQFASTAQINPAAYLSAFEAILRAGQDVLYLSFSSGMSGSYQNACQCVRELQERYPQRRLICIDTLCASVGEGFLVREAARKQGEGLSIDELAQWVTERRLQVCHWFTVDTFDHLRHGGRVSAAAAVAGTMLQVKPLLHVDKAGALQVMEKPRGRHRAMEAQLARMKRGWLPDLGTLVVIGHGDCPEAGGLLQAAVAHQFPSADIYTADIGPVIGSHTGPGMLALIFWGSER